MLTNTWVPTLRLCALAFTNARLTMLTIARSTRSIPPDSIEYGIDASLARKTVGMCVFVHTVLETACLFVQTVPEAVCVFVQTVPETVGFALYLCRNREFH